MPLIWKLGSAFIAACFRRWQLTRYLGPIRTSLLSGGACRDAFGYWHARWADFQRGPYLEVFCCVKWRAVCGLACNASPPTQIRPPRTAAVAFGIRWGAAFLRTANGAGQFSVFSSAIARAGHRLRGHFRDWSSSLHRLYMWRCRLAIRGRGSTISAMKYQICLL